MSNMAARPHVGKWFDGISLVGPYIYLIVLGDQGFDSETEFKIQNAHHYMEEFATVHSRYLNASTGVWKIYDFDPDRVRYLQCRQYCERVLGIPIADHQMNAILQQESKSFWAGEPYKKDSPRCVPILCRCADSYTNCCCDFSDGRTSCRVRGCSKRG